MRYKEIDYLRALAIILMIAYHFAYDLQVYGGLPVDYQGKFWALDGKLAALLFIFLSGLCSGLSRNPGKRGLIVFSFGMGITYVTYLFIRPEYIRFGILHFIGVAMLLAPLLKRMPNPLLFFLALISVYIGFWAGHSTVSVSFLFPFGFRDSAFQSADYYPLFPYLSVSILGILAYKYVYAGRFRDSLPGPGGAPRFNTRQPLFHRPVIQTLSRNSLAIYLIHQPVLLAGLFAAAFLAHHLNIQTFPGSLISLAWLPAGLLGIVFLAFKSKFNRI